MRPSKTALLDAVKRWDAPVVEEMLVAAPHLADVRDERGRNWLHVCCGVELGQRDAQASIATAQTLLGLGFSVDKEAFTEGAWRATPVWYAIGRGRNLALAEFLLAGGCDPNHCLFAAAYNHDLEALHLLARYGATIDDPSAGETPFLGAIGWSHFAEAEELLKLGADVNAKALDGRTALHMLLKKGSDKAHFPMLIAHGAQGDIPDKTGATARQIMRRKQDPDFRAMAEQLL